MHKVILRRCEHYDPAAIRRIVREGMAELGVHPRGRLLIKPNVVFAHKRYGQHGYTRPEVLAGLVDALPLEGISDLVLGERTAVTIPTRFSFQNAGYSALKGQRGMRFCFFDEDAKVEVALKKGTLHTTLKLAKTFVEADFKIYVPKLKNHASTLLTCALKLNIGICDSNERLEYHDWRLEEKIADLYEAGNPDFIVVDAIEIGQQAELVPKPMHLGVLIMGTSGVAVDSVCARILGLRPDAVKHLKITRARGWEPVNDDDIEITGDVTLAELASRTARLDRTFNDLNEINFPVRQYFGFYPNGSDYCHTGCMSMLKTSFALMEAYHPGNLKIARPVTIVVGEYQGAIDGGGLPVILVGDCTKVSGGICNGKIVRIRGCPVTVPFFMNAAAWHMGVKNPYLDTGAMISFPVSLMVSKVKKALAKLFAANCH